MVADLLKASKENVAVQYFGGGACKSRFSLTRLFRTAGFELGAISSDDGYKTASRQITVTNFLTTQFLLALEFYLIKASLLFLLLLY
jgi:hypothetical protein